MTVFGRSNPVVRSQKDGTFKIVLAAPMREVIDDALGQVEDLLDNPDDPLVARLAPPAYEDDPANDLAYQLIAGEQLRTARREAIATVRRIHEQSTATEDELWAWLRALNALRLVLGTALGIESDDDEFPELDDDDPALPMVSLYGLTSEVQMFIIDALD